MKKIHLTSIWDGQFQATGAKTDKNSIQSIGDAATTGQEFNSLLKNIAVADVPLQGCTRVVPLSYYSLMWSPIDKSFFRGLPHSVVSNRYKEEE